MKTLDFHPKLISARIKQKDGKLGLEHSHLAILANIDGLEYLTDTGFGDFTAEPLKFVPDVEQKDESGTFIIKKFDDRYFEVLKKDRNNLNSEYVFDTLKRDSSEFEDMCNLSSNFARIAFYTRKSLFNLLTGGRKTLTDKKFIKTLDGQ